MMVIIKGTLKVDYNETEANGVDIKERMLQAQGGIFPVKNPDNQYMKSVKVIGQEIVILMVIERLKFRQIVFSVSQQIMN
jgi:hypothetical protein